jgi:hypothetical protein
MWSREGSTGATSCTFSPTRARHAGEVPSGVASSMASAVFFSTGVMRRWRLGPPVPCCHVRMSADGSLPTVMPMAWSRSDQPRWPIPLPLTV